MGKQNPNIKLLPDTKTKLQSLKKQPSDTYDNVINRVIQSTISPQQYQNVPQQYYGKGIKSAVPQSNNISVIGAGSGLDAYNTYGHLMNYIQDTLKKMPSGGEYETTPSMREQAYDIDPLVNGIITPFLKNVILSDHILETKDNKKYAEMIDDIEEYLKEIKLMKVYREDFEDLVVKHGHSYRRKDYYTDKEGYLKKLQRLEARAMKTYEDPFDSDIVLYHQNIYAADMFSSNITSSNSAINSWWIPDGLTLNRDLDIAENGAEELWQYYQNKYYINETNRLRVGDSDDIIAMHRVRPGKPAPIDSIIQAIWEKRTLIANIPNVIYAVLYPFIQLQHGQMFETTDEQGIKILKSSLPQPPPAGMAVTDPERYADMNAAVTAYNNGITNNAKNIHIYRKEGGIFATGPDVKANVIESASTIASSFIREVLSQFNEEIGQGLGFPVSLVMARGTELATSRAIQDLFNTVYASTRQDYQDVADKLIEERFAGQTWDYELELKDGTTEKGKFTFEETDVQFKLSNGDVTDNLKVAQTELINFQSAQIAKTIGATKADIQAFFDEKDQGLWDLDNFDVKAEPANPFASIPGMANEQSTGAPPINKPEVPTVGKPELPADVKKPPVSEQIKSSISTGVTKEKFDISAPEVIPKKQDKSLEQDLMDAYKVCEEEMKALLVKE